MSAPTRKDWILWGALGCTLVGTAHAEYTLATATGVHWFVAASVPGALDLYVIRALQVHRDVLAAVLAMVVINVASHLVTAGVLPVHWGLISAVGALAPLVLWRIHYLWRLQSAGSAPAPETSAEPSAPVLDAPAWDVDRIPEWMQEEYRASAPVADIGSAHPATPSGSGALAPATVRGCTHWECEGVQGCTQPSAPVRSTRATAAEFIRQGAGALHKEVRESAPHPDVECVLDSDKRNGGRTSMRALRAEYGWGQKRATAARNDTNEHLKKEAQP